MSNITLNVDDTIIRKVRKIAIDKNTTLTQMVRDFLVSVAEQDSAARKKIRKEVEQSFRQLSRDMGSRSWTREGLHER